MENRFVRGALGASIFLAVLAAAAAAVMLLWNALIPEIAGWTAIGFWQAAGLIVLCRLLFGGIGRGMHGPFAGPGRAYSWEERARMRDRVRRMDPDERRDYIRRHMFGRCPGQPAKPDDENR